VIINARNTISMMSTIRGGLNKIQPIINEIVNISKLPTIYKDFFVEIIRRKGFDDRNKKVAGSYQTRTQKELQDELVRRNAFSELKGNTLHLKPLLNLLNKPPQSPQITLPADESLPDLGEIPTVEDDFCFVEEGTPEERLKRVEREKGEMAETLAAITKELSQSKQIMEELNKQISSLTSLSSTKPVKEQSSTQREETENEQKALKENISKQTQEIQLLRKRNQILITEVDQSSQKIKDLEQQITVMENSSPDIRKLRDMGFPIELVRKALAANSSIDGAVQWLLESSQV